MEVIAEPIQRKRLADMAARGFGDLMKAVVDVERAIMAVDAEPHSHEEAALLEGTSRQEDLWGVNICPDLPRPRRVEFDSLISIRPLRGNRSRGVDDPDESGASRRLRIHHIHMEEDVAKLVHEMEGRLPISLVGFTRAGAPLVEIVTEPDIRTPHEAMEFVKELRTLVRYSGSSECSMENGTVRVDANTCVRPRGTTQLNTKVDTSPKRS